MTASFTKLWLAPRSINEVFELGDGAGDGAGEGEGEGAPEFGGGGVELTLPPPQLARNKHAPVSTA
jgi:hypothetical protein